MKKFRQTACSNESYFMKAVDKIEVEQMDEEEPPMGLLVHLTLVSAISIASVQEVLSNLQSTT